MALFPYLIPELNINGEKYVWSELYAIFKDNLPSLLGNKPTRYEQTTRFRRKFEKSWKYSGWFVDISYTHMQIGLINLSMTIDQ